LGSRDLRDYTLQTQKEDRVPEKKKAKGLHIITSEFHDGEDTSERPTEKRREKKTKANT